MTAKKVVTIKLLILSFLCLNLLQSDFATAQQEPSFSERSYKQARQVLESGIRALGGLENIASIKNFTIIETAKYYDIAESRSPEPPLDTSIQDEKTIIDFSRSRLFNEVRHTWTNYVYRPTLIIDGSKGFRVDMWSKRASAFSPPSVNNYPQLIQKLPQFLLRDVLTERAASLRSLPDVSEKGRRLHVITFVNREAQQVSLYFDSKTSLLTKYEFLYTDSCVGDSKQQYLFPGYRSLGNLKVPVGLNVRMAGHSAQEIRYERIDINTDLNDDLFALPPGVELVTAGATPPTPQPYSITRIANDIYLIQRVGGFNNVLAVAFNDYVLVIEAPETPTYSRASEQVIAKIKETLPGKPIKFLVFTHHHLDHGCGARGYISEGTTIVTTPGNKQFVERLAAAPFTINPDLQARNPRRPIIELIENKKRKFTDGNQIVELYDIGPYWHASEELIVYFPKEKLLFEGDLFTSGSGDIVPMAQAKTVLLADKIRQLGLDVDSIIGVHGRLRPIKDLYESIERMKRNGGK